MLVAAPERWDEACFAVPAIRALAASGIGVGVLCPDSQRVFWQSVQGVAVVPYPVKTKTKVTAAGISGNWQASLAWEAGYCAEVFKLAGITRRLGPTEKKLGKWLTHPLKFVADPLEHRVRFYLGAVEELGITTTQPEFFAPADFGAAPDRPAVLLCPGSDFGSNHEWDLGRWKQVASSLLDGGFQLSIADVDDARGLGKSLAGELAGRAELLPPSPMAAVLPSLATHHLVVAADGSLPHLAAHAGATCVTLFGPNDPAWKRPLGRRHLAVRRHVECAPCLLSKCPMDLRCQRELDVDRVLQAVTEKLAQLA